MNTEIATCKWGRGNLAAVAILCPPFAAVTMVINKMCSEGGTFLLLSHMPVQVGALASANGQANMQMYQVLTFMVNMLDWESKWGKYDPLGVLPMQNFLSDKPPQKSPLLRGDG